MKDFKEYMPPNGFYDEFGRKLYREECDELKAEFFKDARVELDYVCWPANVVSMVETKAWEEGHATGYSEIFGILDELVEWTRSVMKEAMSNEFKL